MAIKILDNFNPCRFMVLVFVSFGFASTTFVGPVFADKPDRCFHTHYNNTTNCKRGIRKKKCNNAKGEKGRCEQISGKCYCKIFKKQGGNQDLSDDGGQELIDLGLAIGVTILNNKNNRKRKKHNKYKKHKKYKEYQE